MLLFHFIHSSAIHCFCSSLFLLLHLFFCISATVTIAKYAKETHSFFYLIAFGASGTKTTNLYTFVFVQMLFLYQIRFTIKKKMRISYILRSLLQQELIKNLVCMGCLCDFIAWKKSTKKNRIMEEKISSSVRISSLFVVLFALLVSSYQFS